MEIDLKSIDFIVVNHAEEDHSGALSALMEKIPNTQNQSFTSFIMIINIEFESIIMVNLNERLIDVRFSLKTLVLGLFSGAIIYLVYPKTMVQGAARTWCHQDSFEATGEVQISNGGKFITLPRPKSQGENDWYFDLFHNSSTQMVNECTFCLYVKSISAFL